MLRIFTFACTVLSIPTFSQRLPSFNKGDNVTTLSVDTIFTFTIIAIGSDFKPSERKTYYWFDQGKIGSAQGGVTGKLLHGDYEAKKKGKGIVAKGKFNKGLKSGIWLQWHSNGKIRSRTSWKKGMKDGVFYEYNQNGDLISKGKYANNNFYGEWRSYQYGKVIQKKKFKNGIEVIKRVKSKKTETSIPTRQQIRKDSVKALRKTNKHKREKTISADSHKIISNPENSILPKEVDSSLPEAGISTTDTPLTEDVSKKKNSKHLSRRKKKNPNE